MSPEQASDMTSANRIRADRIQLLYWQSSFPAVFVSIALATLVAMLLWPAASHFAVTAWFAVLLATSMARLALFWAYRAKAPTGLALLDWERPYFVTLMASTLT